MTHLKTAYSKYKFRIGKQYKHMGYVKIKISDFRERLDIPSSYRMTTINQKLLNSIINELSFILNKRKTQMTNVNKQRDHCTKSIIKDILKLTSNRYIIVCKKAPVYRQYWGFFLILYNPVITKTLNLK